MAKKEKPSKQLNPNLELQAVIYSLATSQIKAGEKFGVTRQTIRNWKEKLQKEGKLDKYIDKPKDHPLLKEVVDAENSTLPELAKGMNREDEITEVEVISGDFVAEAKSLRLKLIDLINQKIEATHFSMLPLKDLTDALKSVTVALQKAEKEDKPIKPSKRNDFVQKSLDDNQDALSQILSTPVENIKQVKIQDDE